MLDEQFVKKQNALFGLYYWVGFVGRSLAGLAIFLSAMTAPTNDTIGPILVWIGIILLIMTGIFRHFLKEALRPRFIAEYARLVGGAEIDTTKTFRQALAGPVVRDNTFSLELLHTVAGNYKGHSTALQDIKATYQKNVPGRDDAIFTLRHTIHAVQLPTAFPHLFIASRRHHTKKLSGGSSLWSLVAKLDPSQKLQALEGDFGKYFDVYTTHQESDGLEFKKENDALRVLTPDVMLSLRDKGFDFDYEIYRDYLYIIHEPDLLTAAELENFILSLDAALSELIPQLVGHDFTDNGSKLKIVKSALTPDILLGPIVGASKWVLVYLTLVILGVLLGSALRL